MTKPGSLFLSVGLLSFVVYLYTLAPTITWRNDGFDSGDLAAAVATGGVPHPPGYPTYLLLGELFSLLPWGDVAYRLNLFSAVCAALSTALMALVIYQTLLMSHHANWPSKVTWRDPYLIWFCPFSAALVLAFSSIFWSQAVITEVYALNALLGAFLLYGGLRVQPANEKWLVPGLAGLLGVSLGNHPSILLLSPLLTGVLKVRWHWQLRVSGVLAFCLGLSVYWLIPVRAAALAPVNWGLAITWPDFLWLVTAEPYRPFLFGLSWSYVPTRVVVELWLLTKAFIGWGLPVGLLGLYRLFRLNRSLAYGSLLAFLLISAYSIGYNTTDSYIYLLPALLIFSLWIGWGLCDVGHICQRFINLQFRRANFTIWSIVFLPLLSLLLNFSAQNISQDQEAYSYARISLQSVPSGAIIITDSDPQTFALWYGRYGLGWRSDVAVVNSNLLAYAWYRQTLSQNHANLHLMGVTNLATFIEENSSRSPIYLATEQPLDGADYPLNPVGNLQLVMKPAHD